MEKLRAIITLIKTGEDIFLTSYENKFKI